jgi:ABC-2 type transport system permease protein
MSTAAIGIEYRKWWATIQVSWSNRMAYKLNFVLLVIAPTLVFFFIKYNLWNAVFDSATTDRIQGFDRHGMLAYQSWVLIVGFLAQGHNSMALSEDIRLGRISSYLIYPFDFWRFHAAEFVAFQCIQSLVASVSIASLTWSGFISWPGIDVISMGILFSWLVSILWFICQFTLGLLSFWLEESWTLRVMFVTVAQFLSGAIIPLEIFPSWLRDATRLLPFADMTYTPCQIFMGQFDGSIMQAIGRVLIWQLLLSALAATVWKRGIRMYTGAGM